MTAVRPLALLLLAMAAALAAGWIGFMASDDALYYAAAARWLDRPPFAGDTHWATRFPLVLEFAGVLAVVGRSYAAFAVAALLPYGLLVWTVWRFARAVHGPRGAWTAALLTATMPVVVAQASTVGVDLLEGALLLSGAGLLAERRGVLAGLCFGLALLCRETSVLPLAGLALPFLLGRPVPRRVLVEAAAACLAVLAAEAAFQWWMTGEPWRRYAIAFHHDEHIDRAANAEGNFLLHPAVDPLLVLLVNDDFGWLFWLLPFAARSVRGARMGLLGAMAAAAFLLVAMLTTKLVLNPRYFLLPALFAAIAVGGWAAGRPWLLGATVAANLLLLSVANPHPRWRMEALVLAARAHPGEVVRGDPADARRAVLPLMLEGGTGRIGSAPAPPGGLVVADAGSAPPGRVLARYPSPPTHLGAVLRAGGLEGAVPEPIRRRMFRPSAEAVLVRAAPAG